MSPENAENAENAQTVEARPTAQAASNPIATTTEKVQEKIREKVREQIIENTYNKTWLYVCLVAEDWKHFEDEQEYIRADGALEALDDLARSLGLADQVASAAAEGRRRLRERAQHAQDHGPARWEEIKDSLHSMMYPGPGDKPYEPHEYSSLHRERARLDDDMKIAPSLIRYLDGEDIEHA